MLKKKLARGSYFISGGMEPPGVSERNKYVFTQSQNLTKIFGGMSERLENWKKVNGLQISQTRMISESSNLTFNFFFLIFFY